MVAGISAQQDSCFQTLTVVPDAASEVIVDSVDLEENERLLDNTGSWGGAFRMRDRTTKTNRTMDEDDVYWKKLFFQNQKLMHEFMNTKRMAETEPPVPNKLQKSKFFNFCDKTARFFWV